VHRTIGTLKSQTYGNYNIIDYSRLIYNDKHQAFYKMTCVLIIDIPEINK